MGISCHEIVGAISLADRTRVLSTTGGPLSSACSCGEGGRDRSACNGRTVDHVADERTVGQAGGASGVKSSAALRLAWARLQTSCRPALSRFWAANQFAHAFWSPGGVRPDPLAIESVGVLGRQLLMSCGSQGLGWEYASQCSLEARIRPASDTAYGPRLQFMALASPVVTVPSIASIAPLPRLNASSTESRDPLTLLPPVMKLAACCPSVWFQMMGVRSVESVDNGRVQLRMRFRGLAQFRDGGSCRCACCRFSQVALRSDVTWECPGREPEVEEFPLGPRMPHEDCFWLVQVADGRYVAFPGDRDGAALDRIRDAGLPVYGPYCYGDSSVPYPDDFPHAEDYRAGNRVSDCEVAWQDTPHFAVDTTNRAGCKLIWTFEISVVVSAVAGCRGGSKAFNFRMELVASIGAGGEVEGEFLRPTGHANPGEWPGGGGR